MTTQPNAPVTPVPDDVATPTNAPVLVEPVTGAEPDEATATHRLPVEPARLAYRLLTGPDDRTFCARVSAALADGYRLYGSPAATFDGERVIVAQAVVLAGVVGPDGAPS